MARRKYQFSSREEAETQYRAADRESLRFVWLVRALVQGRIKWTRRKGKAYRFAAFVPNTGSPWSEPLIVEEFKPSNTQQEPSFHVYDAPEFREREMGMLRIGPSDEVNGWIEGAREVKNAARALVEKWTHPNACDALVVSPPPDAVDAIADA